MVKDRLIELQQYQNKEKIVKNKTTNIPVENDKQNATQNLQNENKTKLRQTFERSEIIIQWIEQIEKNNEEIRRFLQRIDDLKFNQKDVENKINSFFQNNKSIAQQITSKLKEVDNELKEPGNLSTAEHRIKTIQYSTLKKRFEEAFSRNNHLLEEFGKIQKQIIKSQLVAKGHFNVTDEEVSLLLEEGTDIQLFTENILAQTAEAKRILADVEERHQQLLQIERMLTEVRDMFLEMSILIDTQQELLDRIEYQAQNATDHIGAVDLAAVRRSKRKYLKTKIYLIIALIVLIIIILIILLK